MFRGINAVNLDAKGRLAMPARYREILAGSDVNQLVVTVDTEDACLLLYPLSVWEIIEGKIIALPSFNPVARRIQRLLIGHASELDMDLQGRILIPPPLRHYAGLEKRAVIIGQGKKFEIWSEACWEQQREMWLEADMDQAHDTLPPELKSISL